MDSTRRTCRSLVLALATSGLFPWPAVAHPGSGIVVDRQGRIYFLDTGAGLWRIDTQGTLTRIPGPNFHWMTLDAHDAFRTAPLPSGSGCEITRVGGAPAFLLSSDFPIVMGPDGTLYFPSHGAGTLRILRQRPSERSSPFATLPPTTAKGPLRWVNGLAIGSDGSLYYTEDDAIRRVSPEGHVSAVVTDLALAGCASIPGNEGPYLRGLAVDSLGSVYVAASGCGRLLKVTLDGHVSTVIQVESPWSPTAVALSGGELIVLEYLHPAAEDRRAWVPRVRRISPDGTSAVIATVDRPKP